MYSDIFKGEIGYLKEHFMEQNKDYVKAMNKIFLLSALFNVDVFHRRDSDTYLISDYTSNYKAEYSIEIEIKYISKLINYINDKIKSNALIFHC